MASATGMATEDLQRRLSKLRQNVAAMMVEEDIAVVQPTPWDIRFRNMRSSAEGKSMVAWMENVQNSATEGAHQMASILNGVRSEEGNQLESESEARTKELLQRVVRSPTRGAEKAIKHFVFTEPETAGALVADAQQWLNSWVQTEEEASALKRSAEEKALSRKDGLATASSSVKKPVSVSFRPETAPVTTDALLRRSLSKSPSKSGRTVTETSRSSLVDTENISRSNETPVMDSFSTVGSASSQTSSTLPKATARQPKQSAQTRPATSTERGRRKGEAQRLVESRSTEPIDALIVRSVTASSVGGRSVGTAPAGRLVKPAPLVKSVSSPVSIESLPLGISAVGSRQHTVTTGGNAAKRTAQAALKTTTVRGPPSETVLSANGRSGALPSNPSANNLPTQRISAHRLSGRPVVKAVKRELASFGVTGRAAPVSLLSSSQNQSCQEATTTALPLEQSTMMPNPHVAVATQQAKVHNASSANDSLNQITKAFQGWRIIALQSKASKAKHYEKLQRTRRALMADLEACAQREIEERSMLLKATFTAWHEVSRTPPHLVDCAHNFQRFRLTRMFLHAWRTRAAGAVSRREAKLVEAQFRVAAEHERFRVVTQCFRGWKRVVSDEKQQRLVREDQERRRLQMENLLSKLQQKQVQVECLERTGLDPVHESTEECSATPEAVPVAETQQQVITRLKRQKPLVRSSTQTAPISRVPSDDQPVKRSTSETNSLLDGMEKRAAERRERRNVILQRQADREARQAEQEKQLEQERAAQRETERRAILAAREARLAQEAEKEAIRKREAAVLQEKLALAELHSARSNIVYRGWIPWMKLVEQSRLTQVQATAWANSQRLKRCFVSLKEYATRRKRDRAHMASMHYFARQQWMAFHKLRAAARVGKANRAEAEFFDRRRRCKVLFRCWRVAATRFIQAREARLNSIAKIAIPFGNQIFLRWYFRNWRINSRTQKKLRSLDNHRQKTWSRVNSWLDEYRSQNPPAMPVVAGATRPTKWRALPVQLELSPEDMQMPNLETPRLDNV